jgi:peptide-methionine (S)-S-oxide reductase
MGSKSARGMMVRIIFYSLLIAAMVSQSSGIRVVQEKEQVTKTAVFAMGSFWRAEAVYGCITGVVRTRVGYSGGSKLNPDYHSIGDHAECIEVRGNPLPPHTHTHSSLFLEFGLGFQ